MATTNTLTGSSQADILNAPGSSVTLVEGLAGNDTITLSKINDEASGGSGADSIVHSPGNSASNVVVDGGEGNDTLLIQSASSFGGTVTMGAGADSVGIGSSNHGLVSGAFIRGGTGNDTLTLASNITSSTIGGGSGADLLTFTQTGTITSSEIIGGQKQDSIDIRGTTVVTSSSINGGKGKDTIFVGTGATSTSALFGGGKGEDSISIASGTHTNSSVSGGAHADTITISTNLGAITSFYGDTVGSTTTSTDAAGDFINSGSAAIITTAASVYGGGGNDTLFWGSFSHSQSLIHGGDGADSMRFANATSLQGSIFGGAGNDTITVHDAANAENNFQNASAIATINGGDGADVIKYGSGLIAMTTAAIANSSFSAVSMVVAYGAGDVIDLGTVLTTASANWAGGGVYSLSAGSFTTVATTTGSLDAVGDIGVFSDGTDSFIAVNTAATNTTSSCFIIKITGKDLQTTTLFGNQALKAANFGFSADYGASTNGLKITLT